MRNNFATSMLLLAASQLEPQIVNGLQITQPQPAPVHTNTLINDNQLPLGIKRKQGEITDASGQQVRLSCVNLYGAQSDKFKIDVDERNVTPLIQRIVTDGFNCVRLPFSLDLFVKDCIEEGLCSDIKHQQIADWIEDQGHGDVAANFDALIEEIVDNDLVVILSNYSSNAQDACFKDKPEEQAGCKRKYKYHDNGMWHTEDYNTDTWVDMLEMIAERYSGNDRVVGLEIRSTISTSKYRDDQYVPTWNQEERPDQHQLTNWKKSATEAALAVQRGNEDLLVIVPGIDNGLGMQTMKQDPIKESGLKLVISIHPDQTWFYEKQQEPSWDTYEQFEGDFSTQYTFFSREERKNFSAPVLISHFGIDYDPERTEKEEHNGAPDAKDDYWDFMMTYLNRNDQINWAFNYYQGIDTINTRDGDWMDVGLNSIKPDKLSSFSHQFGINLTKDWTNMSEHYSQAELIMLQNPVESDNGVLKPMTFEDDCRLDNTFKCQKQYNDYQAFSNGYESEMITNYGSPTGNNILTPYKFPENLRWKIQEFQKEVTLSPTFSNMQTYDTALNQAFLSTIEGDLQSSEQQAVEDNSFLKTSGYMSNALVYRLEKCAQAFARKNSCNLITNIDQAGKCSEELVEHEDDPGYLITINEWFDIEKEKYCDLIGGQT